MRNYLSILIFCFTANFVFATNVTVNNYTALVSAVGGTADTIYINGTIVIWQHLPVYRNLVFIGINNGTLNGNNNQRGMAIGATKVEIHNLTFINGGDYMFGCAFIVQLTDTLIVKNCHFLNNTASIGGAIYGQYNNYILLENCEFKNNHTTGEGGAICMMAGATSEGRVCSLYIVNCLFYNNSVETADGGAIYAHFLNNLIIFNSLFYNNSSLNLGGAIRIENTPCNIINSTIVKNTSNGGGGIWSMNIGPNLYNSIIVGNTANIGGANQADILGEPANIYNSIYQGVFSIGNNINNFSGILPANIFVDYNNDDFHLLCSSVAIDGGNNTDYVNQWNTAFSANTITSPIVHNDIGGNVRLLGSNIDMGAYETLAFNETISDSFCEGDTYDFNGRILTNGGVYYDTITNALGCDTIIKLNLTKLSISRYEYKDTSYKCEWYYFGGDSLNNTDIYIDTLVARNGCDSIVTLDLLVRPREFDDTLNICVDRLPVTVYDTVFSKTAVSGTYIIHHRCATITFLLNVSPQVQTQQPEIPKICANDGSFILSFPPTNSLNTKPPTNYSITFDNHALTAGFVNQSGEFDGTDEITVQMPIRIYPDYYNCQIALIDSIYNCTAQAFDIQFPVFYPDTIMQQKWDDVVALKNSYYNGGFDFAGYQWYKNGNILAGETYSYIYLGTQSLQIGDEYSVLILRNDGSTLFSCPFTAREPKPQQSTFPTIVQNGNSVTIYLSKGDATAKLWTVTGILLQTARFSAPMHEISMPTVKGAYILEIVPENQTIGRAVNTITIH